MVLHTPMGYVKLITERKKRGVRDGTSEPSQGTFEFIRNRDE